MIAVYIHPKNSNYFRSHFIAIMALDHSRLSLENEFLENKSGRIFCVRQVFLTKYCQQLWERVNQHFVLFIHHIWNSNMRRCFYHIDLRQNAVFYNFSRQIALIQYSEPYEARVGFQQNRSKNFQNHLYGQPVLTFDKRQIFSEH